MVNHEKPFGLYSLKDVESWLEGQAEKKAKILDEKVDVYFEDSPDVVKYLRKYCKKCLIIHYGGRW